MNPGRAPAGSVVSVVSVVGRCLLIRLFIRARLETCDKGRPGRPCRALGTDGTYLTYDCNCYKAHSCYFKYIDLRLKLYGQFKSNLQLMLKIIKNLMFYLYCFLVKNYNIV